MKKYISICIACLLLVQSSVGFSVAAQTETSNFDTTTVMTDIGTQASDTTVTEQSEETTGTSAADTSVTDEETTTSTKEGNADKTKKTTQISDEDITDATTEDTTERTTDRITESTTKREELTNASDDVTQETEYEEEPEDELEEEEEYEDDEERVITPMLIILNKNGKIAARVTGTARTPVEGVEVGVQLGTTKMPGVVTDADGYAVFQYAFPEDDTYIHCYTEQTRIGNTVYEAAAATVGSALDDNDKQTTTQKTEKTTDTTARSSTVNKTKRTKRTTTTDTADEEQEQLTWYTASGTTGMEESYIALEFSFDSGILDAFKTEENSFTKNAKLLMLPENYDHMLGKVNGTLMVSAASSKEKVTDEQITAAVASDAVLSRVDAADVERIVMDLSLQMKDNETDEVTDVWNIAEGTYVVQMPIPQSMRSAQVITVAAFTDDGMSEPIYAHVSEEGFFRFESNSPTGTIVVLGFKGSMLGALTGDAARSAMIFLVAGIVCIVLAIVIYFRFVRRPKRRAKPQLEPVPAADLPPLNSDYEQLGLFGDDDDGPAPLRNKGNNDIDIPL